jgi:hypothetical protein
MNKSTSMNLAEVAQGKYGVEIDDIVKSYPTNLTCFDALIDADLIRYNPETGLYKPNPKLDTFKKNIQDLDKYTQTACFPNGTVKGVVGFASPARLFYSDLLNSETNLNHISQLMAKSIIENDVFYLTVNYSNDPFGFSNSENFTFKKLQEDKSFIKTNFNKGQGFIYNKSNNYVPRTFITAHLAYWDTPKRFAKAIVRAFNEGYPHFYELD